MKSGILGEPKAGLPKAFPVIAVDSKFYVLRMSAPRFSMSWQAPTDHTRCDDGVMPLICPTCQLVSQDAPHAGSRRLLCMGLFSIFLLSGHGSRGPSLISSCVGG
jgi:hypothetical protein